MYSKAERQKAVDLYIRYGKRAAMVVSELGYPNRHTLRLWYKEFKEEGYLREGCKKREGHSLCRDYETVRSGRQSIISSRIGGPTLDGQGPRVSSRTKPYILTGLTGQTVIMPEQP